MKCPQCGYVCFADLSECKKCGHHFAQTEEPKNSPSTIPISHGRETSLFPPEPRQRPGAPPPRGREPVDAAASFLAGGLKPAISDASSPLKPRTSGAARNTLDCAFVDRPSGGNKPDLVSIPLGRSVRPVLDRDASPANRRMPDDFAGALRSRPDVVEFTTGPATTARARVNDDEIPAAPLGKRFLAAVVDALILLAAACLFAGLFTAARGRLELHSLDLVVVGFIALFWVFFYFDLFTAFALRTPGQAAFGLSVRNLDGDPPTHTESLLRAFGYLVSIVALMVGFLWAAMDSDGMAWHDHISGTLLVDEREPRGTP